MIGTLRPMPKAFEVTRNPGAACRLLYSFIRILFDIFFTKSESAPLLINSEGDFSLSINAETSGLTIS